MRKMETGRRVAQFTSRVVFNAVQKEILIDYLKLIV